MYMGNGAHIVYYVHRNAATGESKVVLLFAVFKDHAHHTVRPCTLHRLFSLSPSPDKAISFHRLLCLSVDVVLVSPNATNGASGVMVHFDFWPIFLVATTISRKKKKKLKREIDAKPSLRIFLFFLCGRKIEPFEPIEHRTWITFGNANNIWHFSHRKKNDFFSHCRSVDQMISIIVMFIL